MSTLVKKIKLTTTMSLLTGMHIGGSKEGVEIGGIDTPVIKMATKQGQPYVPGSSLKGKMRCLLEQVNGAAKVGDCEKVNKLFGFSGKALPSKLIVRDSYLTQGSVELMTATTSLDMPFTENKFENTIDRIKGVAEHPRQIERVPAGAKFAVEMIVNIWDSDNENDLLALVSEAIALLENDYLGGSGSRGYGQVKFDPIVKTVLSPENNWTA